MSFDNTGTCLSYTSTLGSANSMTSNPFTPGAYTPTTGTTVYGLKTTGETVGPMTNSNMQSNAFCTNAYTINPTVQSDESYDLAATTLNFDFVTFTLGTACADLAWSYAAYEVGSGTS